VGRAGAEFVVMVLTPRWVFRAVGMCCFGHNYQALLFIDAVFVDGQRVGRAQPGIGYARICFEVETADYPTSRGSRCRCKLVLVAPL
jgi:hypothetical protein